MKLRPNLQTFGFVAPTFVGQGNFITGTNTITATIPGASTTNDILLYLICYTSTITVQPTGFTAFGGIVGTQTNLVAYWKRHDGSEPSATLTQSGATGLLGSVLAFRGCVATGSPIDQTQTSENLTNQTALTCPAITAPFPNTMVINMVGVLLDATTTTEFSGWTNASLLSITEVLDGTTSNGSGAGLGAAYGVKETAGAVATTTLTGVTNVQHTYITFNLIGTRT